MNSARLLASGAPSSRPGSLAAYVFSALHTPGVRTDAAVARSRQRLECGDLSPLSSASASQLAADSPVARATAPTGWRTPNATATAKRALSLPACRVRHAPPRYSPSRRRTGSTHAGAPVGRWNLWHQRFGEIQCSGRHPACRRARHPARRKWRVVREGLTVQRLRPGGKVPASMAAAMARIQPLALACFVAVGWWGSAAGALAADPLADPQDALSGRRLWGDFVETNFPFFSCVLDARKAGDGLPADNLTPRGIVLDLDLKRVV